MHSNIDLGAKVRYILYGNNSGYLLSFMDRKIENRCMRNTE